MSQATVIQMLKTARGQIDGLLKMIDNGRGGMDLSNQIMAAESVLHKANREVVRMYLRGCMRTALQNPDEMEDEIEGMLAALDKFS